MGLLWICFVYRIQWSWVQIPLRTTFYSYFKESISSEYHIYTYIRYIYIYIYILYIIYYIIYFILYFIYVYKRDIFWFPPNLGRLWRFGRNRNIACLEINVLYILYITKRDKPRNTSNDPKFKMLEHLWLNFRNDKREFQMTFNERLKNWNGK